MPPPRLALGALPVETLETVGDFCDDPEVRALAATCRALAAVFVHWSLHIALDEVDGPGCVPTRLQVASRRCRRVHLYHHVRHCRSTNFCSPALLVDRLRVLTGSRRLHHLSSAVPGTLGAPHALAALLPTLANLETVTLFGLPAAAVPALLGGLSQAPRLRGLSLSILDEPAPAPAPAPASTPAPAAPPLLRRLALAQSGLLHPALGAWLDGQAPAPAPAPPWALQAQGSEHIVWGFLGRHPALAARLGRLQLRLYAGRVPRPEVEAAAAALGPAPRLRVLAVTAYDVTPSVVAALAALTGGGGGALEALELVVPDTTRTLWWPRTHRLRVTVEGTTAARPRAPDAESADAPSAAPPPLPRSVAFVARTWNAAEGHRLLFDGLLRDPPAGVHELSLDAADGWTESASLRLLRALRLAPALHTVALRLTLRCCVNHVPQPGDLDAVVALFVELRGPPRALPNVTVCIHARALTHLPHIPATVSGGAFQVRIEPPCAFAAPHAATVLRTVGPATPGARDWLPTVDDAGGVVLWHRREPRWQVHVDPTYGLQVQALRVKRRALEVAGGTPPRGGWAPGPGPGP